MQQTGRQACSGPAVWTVQPFAETWQPEERWCKGRGLAVGETVTAARRLSGSDRLSLSPGREVPRDVTLAATYVQIELRLWHEICSFTRSSNIYCVPATCLAESPKRNERRKTSRPVCPPQPVPSRSAEEPPRPGPSTAFLYAFCVWISRWMLDHRFLVFNLYVNGMD